MALISAQARIVEELERATEAEIAKLKQLLTAGMARFVELRKILNETHAKMPHATEQTIDGLMNAAARNSQLRELLAGWLAELP